MFELEFAFFDVMKYDKRGLLYQKYLLDRLAPFLFAPRVKQMIDLPVLNARGYHVSLPLGTGNLESMEPEKKQHILGRSIAVAEDFELPALAVDRRLKPHFPNQNTTLKIHFGDHFIKALAAAYVKHMLSKRPIKRVVVATDFEDVTSFVSYLAAWGCPLSIQSYHPMRYEPLSYQMMYQEGYTLTTSMFNPDSWEPGDLVVLFDPVDRFLTVSFPDVSCLQLNNHTTGLAPLVEAGLRQYGIDACLYNLAPIMELCIWSLSSANIPMDQRKSDEISQPESFVHLEEIANSLGLWELFLDKER